MNEYGIADGVVQKLLIATLSSKDQFAVEKDGTVVFSQRVNNNLVKVAIHLRAAGKGFHLASKMLDVPAENRTACGEYLHRLNKLLAEEGEALGAFMLDFEGGAMTYESTYYGFAGISSHVVKGYVEDGVHQLSRFGNLLQASSFGENAEELTFRSVACLTL